VLEGDDPSIWNESINFISTVQFKCVHVFSCKYRSIEILCCRKSTSTSNAPQIHNDIDLLVVLMFELTLHKRMVVDYMHSQRINMQTFFSFSFFFQVKMPSVGLFRISCFIFVTSCCRGIGTRGAGTKLTPLLELDILVV
jgi:hypothetical protein